MLDSDTIISGKSDTKRSMQINSKPPVAPKPSNASSSMATNRLKNRLILGWHIDNYSEQDGINSKTIKGFGEERFDMLESGYVGLEMESGLWNPNVSIDTFTKTDSILEMNSNFESNAINNGHDLVSKKSLLVPGAESSYIRSAEYTSSITTYIANKSSLRNSNKTKKKSEISSSSSLVTSHLSLSSMFMSNGWDGITNSIVSGESEFCYLKSEHSNHYKFSIMDSFPNSILSNQYTTLSKRGVMRSTMDGESEFTDYPTILRQESIYRSLKKIPVFARYHLWKMFLVWKTGVRDQKFHNHSQLISKNLCTAHLFYQKLILHVMQSCEELQCLDVFVLNDASATNNSDEVLELNVFATKQYNAMKNYKQIKAYIIESVINYICNQGKVFIYSNLDTAPKSITAMKYKELKFTQGTTIISVEDMLKDSVMAHNSIGNVGNNDTIRHSPNKTNNKSSQSNEKTINMGVSYTEKATIRNNCRRLSNVFHIVDYMFRSSLYISIEVGLLKLLSILGGTVGKSLSTITNPTSITTQDVSYTASPTRKATYSSIKKTGKKASYLPNLGQKVRAFLKVKITMSNIKQNDIINNNNNSNQELGIEPNKSKLYHTFRDVILDFIKVGIYQEGLFYNAQCLDVLSSISNELNKIALDDILSTANSSVFKMVEKCINLYNQYLTSILEHIKAFSFLCDEYINHKRISLKIEESRLVHMTSLEISENFAIFENSYMKCLKVSEFQEIGIFQLDFSEVRLKSLEVIQICKNQYMKMVPELFVNNGEKFYTEISRSINVLTSKHSNIDEFVKLVDVYNNALKEYDSFTERFQYIMNLREIIQVQSIPITQDIEKHDLTLVNLWQRFSQNMSLFESEIEGQLKVYKTQLIVRTKALLEPVERAGLFIKADEVNSITSQADEVLSLLSAHVVELDKVREKGKVIEHYQEVMCFTVYKVDVVEDVKTIIFAMIMLWTEVKRIQSVQEKLYESKFLDAESIQVSKELSNCSANLSQASKAGISLTSTVYLWLDQTLRDLLVITPIIRKLQSNSQKEFHIERIHSIVKRKIFTEYDMTVKMLMEDVEIHKYANEIDSIYEESIFLYNIETISNQLEKQVHNQVFQYKEEKGFFASFSNLNNISIMITDALISIQSCQVSKHAITHLKKLKLFETQLQEWIEILQKLILLQNGYLRLRYLFTNPKTARYLGQSMSFFKEVDEVWRNFIKAIKLDPKLKTFFSDLNIDSIITNALSKIIVIDQHVLQYCDSLQSKYPKLYLLQTDHLLDVLSTVDPLRTFKKTQILFPNYTSVHFSETDKYSTESISSYGEKMLFARSCSARNSLIDWFKAIEASVHERLEKDITDYVMNNKELDDFKTVKSCEQSRICTIQIQFWFQVLDTFGKQNRKKSALKPQLSALRDQISMYSSYSQNLIDHYQIKTISNILILLINFRDLLQDIVRLDDYEMHQGPESPFIIDISIKKIWNYTTSSIVVFQGPYTYSYGMKYSGFCDRLVLTPLTDKCFLSISNAMNQFCVPIVTSSVGSGKRAMMNALSNDFGMELFHIDFGNIQSPQVFFQILKAQIHSGLWLCLNNMEQCLPGMLSICFTSLSAISNAFQCKLSQFTLAGTKFELNSSSAQAQPRITLLFNTDRISTAAYKMDLFTLPVSVRHQFRNIFYQGPSPKAIFDVLLTAYNFQSVVKFSFRLVGFCEHMANYNLVPNEIIYTNIFKAIKFVGIKYNYKDLSGTESNGNTNIIPFHIMIDYIIKAFFKGLPISIQHSISPKQFRYISNLYLDSLFINENDLKEFQTEIPSDSCFSLLCEYLHDTNYNCIMVVGLTNVGKSSLIKNAIEKVILQQKQAIAAYNSQFIGKAANNLKMKTDPILYFYPHRINPYLMSNNPGPDKYSRDFYSGLCPSNKTEIGLNAEKLLHQIIFDASNIGSDSNIPAIHIDVPSSMHVATLLSSTLNSLSSKASLAKLIWEVPECKHLDPFMLSQVRIVTITEPLFSIDDVLNLQMKNITESQTSQFRMIIIDSINKYIKPCIKNYVVNETLLATSSLLENALKMFLSVCALSELLNDPTNAKAVEPSIHRVAILSCIWTFGVCAKNTRKHFEQWFKSYFSSQHSSIFPAFEVKSIYDYSLVRSNELMVYLEWSIFDSNSIIAIIDNLKQNLDDSTSEKRLVRSYQDIYYTNLLHHSIDSPSILLPTSTATTYTLIQAALMHSCGAVLVTGPHGSGKSSLLRQFASIAKTITNAKYSTSVASRWICHVKDCSPVELQQHMYQCKLNILPKILERKLTDHGIIMVDDVNIMQEYDSNISCVEFLRQACETKVMYDPTKELWNSFQTYFAMIGSKSIQTTNNDTEYHKVFNKRLIRQYSVLFCEYAELEDIFETKFLRNFNEIKDDLAKDITKITFRYATYLKELFQSIYVCDTIEKVNHFSSLDIYHKLFITFTTQSSLASIVEYLLSKTYTGLISLTAYTSNDVIRIWDRVITDYTLKFTHFNAEIANEAHEMANSNYNYEFPSFTSFVDREKLLRSQAYENILSYLPANTKLVLPLSYTKNAYGFFKTGNDVYTGLSTAEFVRDNYFKRFGKTHLPVGIPHENIACWHDIMNLISILMYKSLSNYKHYLLLHGNNTSYLQSKLIQTSCSYLDASYQYIYLCNSFSTFETKDHLDKNNDFTSYEAKEIDSKIDSNSSNNNDDSSPNNMDENNNIIEEQKEYSFQEMFSNFIVSNFLKDEKVLLKLKEYIKIHTGRDRLIEPTSTSALNIFYKKFSKYQVKLLKEIASKYNQHVDTTSDRTTLPTDSDGIILKEERIKNNMKVWHINVSNEAAVTPNIWTFIHESLELRSLPIIQFLKTINNELNPYSSTFIRGLIDEYVSMQRYVFTFEDSQAKEVVYSLEQMSIDAPDLYSNLKYLTTFDSYSSADKALAQLIGFTESEFVLKLIDECTACVKLRAGSDSASGQYNTVFHAIDSVEYRSGTVESVISLYQKFLQQGKKWTSQLIYFATYYGTYRDNISGFSDISEQHSTEDIENRHSKLSTSLFTDALLNVLYCRYYSIIIDEVVDDNNYVITWFQNLHNKLVHMGFVSTLADDTVVTLDILPLATASALLYFQCNRNPLSDSVKVDQESGEVATVVLDNVEDELLYMSCKLQKMLLLCCFLPRDSQLRSFLSSICLLVVTEDVLKVMDDSIVSHFLLQSVLEMTNRAGGDYQLNNKTEYVNDPLHRLSFKISKSSFIPHSTNSSDLPMVTSDNTKSLHGQEIPVLITCYSKIMSELFLVLALKDNLFEISSNITSSWQYIHEKSFQKPPRPFSRTVNVDSEWMETVSRIHHAMRTLSVLFQELSYLPSIQSFALFSIWNELLKILSYMPQVIHSVDYKENVSVMKLDVLLSHTMVVFVEWLSTTLLGWEYASWLLNVVLNLYYDSSATAIGNSTALRLLHALKLSPEESIGILNNEKRNINKDTEEEKNKNEVDEDDEEEEEDVEFVLSDVSHTSLKHALLIISQTLSHRTISRSIASTFSSNSSAKKGSALTNSSILSSLKTDIEEWSDWAADIRILDMPEVKGYTMNWLEKIAIAIHLKPSVVNSYLKLALFEIGCNILDTEDTSIILETANKKELLLWMDSSTTSSSKDNATVTTSLSSFSPRDMIADLVNIKSMTHTDHLQTLKDVTNTTSVSYELVSLADTSATTPQNMLHIFLTTDPNNNGKLCYTIEELSSLFKLNFKMNRKNISKFISHYVLLDTEPFDSNVIAYKNINNFVSKDYSKLRKSELILLELSKRITFKYNQKKLIRPLVVDNYLIDYHIYTNAHANKESQQQGRILKEREQDVVTSIYPYITTRPGSDKYVDLLEYCYLFCRRIVLFNNESSLSNPRFIRICWILLLFHSSVVCKIPHLNAIIGMNQLSHAMEFINFLLSVQSESSIAFTNSANTTSNNPAEVLLRGINNKQITMQRSILPNTMQKLYTNALPWTTNVLLGYIVDTFYCQVIPSEMMIEKLRSIFNCYCTVGSCDPDSKYLIRGKISLPASFESDAMDVQSFFAKFRELESDRVSYIELVDHTLACVNSQYLKDLHVVIQHNLIEKSSRKYSNAPVAVVNDRNYFDKLRFNKYNLFTNSKIISNLVATMNQRSYLLSLKACINMLKNILPTVIDFQDKDVRIQMGNHLNSISSNPTSKDKATATTVKGGGGNQTIPVALEGLKGNQKVDMRRRVAQRIVVKLYTREFDPMWAYLLTECLHFNETVSNLSSYIQEFLSIQIPLFEYLSNSMKGLREDMIEFHKMMNVIDSLQHGYVPYSWLNQSNASIHGLSISKSNYCRNDDNNSNNSNNNMKVKLEDWFNQLLDRRNMLYEWLVRGHPGFIKLHLLQNPMGLLYSMKETFSMKTNVPIDKLYERYQLLDMKTVNTEDLELLCRANDGCSVVITDLQLYNAILGNEKDSSIEFIPDYYASSYGKKLKLHILISTDEMELTGEEYLCPLYVDSDLPKSIDFFHQSKQSIQQLFGFENRSFLSIPLNTSEDVEDCKMFGIALFCCPKWCSPI